MLRLSILLLVCTSCQTLIAQVNPYEKTAQVLPYWKVGDSRQYRITYDRSLTGADDTLHHTRIVVPVSVAVTDSSETGYTMVWNYGEPVVQYGRDAFTTTLKLLYHGCKANVHTDEYGNVTIVDNLDHLRRRNDSLKTTVPPSEFKTGVNGWENTSMRYAEEVYFSEDPLTTLQRDILLFYTFHGQVYRFQDPVKRREKMANPFGGAWFDAETETELTAYDTREQTAVIKRQKTADHVQVLEEVYPKLLSRLPEDADNDFPDPENMPPMNLETLLSVQIHAASGWVLYAMAVREINLGKGLVVEEVTLEME